MWFGEERGDAGGWLGGRVCAANSDARSARGAARWERPVDPERKNYLPGARWAGHTWAQTARWTAGARPPWWPLRPATSSRPGAAASPRRGLGAAAVAGPGGARGRAWRPSRPSGRHHELVQARLRSMSGARQAGAAGPVGRTAMAGATAGQRRRKSGRAGAPSSVRAERHARLHAIVRDRVGLSLKDGVQVKGASCRVTGAAPPPAPQMKHTLAHPRSSRRDRDRCE